MELPNPSQVLPDALQHMVKRELPASVYRCKGIIFTTDSDEPHALQVVGRRCDITPSNSTGPRNRNQRTRRDRQEYRRVRTQPSFRGAKAPDVARYARSRNRQSESSNHEFAFVSLT